MWLNFRRKEVVGLEPCLSLWEHEIVDALGDRPRGDHRLVSILNSLGSFTTTPEIDLSIKTRKELVEFLKKLEGKSLGVLNRLERELMK